MSEAILNQLETENEELIAGGGLNLMSLFGGFDGVIVTLLVSIYAANKDKLGEAADRAFTLSDANLNRLMKTLGIDASKKDELKAAFDSFADHAGDVLVAIADAKAG